MDAVEVLPAVCLLQVLFAFLPLTINLPHKPPVVFPYLSTSSPIYKSVFGFDLPIQCFSFSLKLKDLLVGRMRTSDMLRYIFQGAQIASDAHMCKGTGKPVDRWPFYNCRLDIKSDPLVEIKGVEDSSVRIVPHDLVTNCCCSRTNYLLAHGEK